jgi:glucosylceramidase
MKNNFLPPLGGDRQADLAAAVDPSISRKAGWLLVAALMLPFALHGQEVSVYRSAMNGDRLTRLPTLRLEAEKTGETGGFKVNAAREFQTMIGFGASFLEAGMIGLNSLEGSQREEVLKALFDPVHGAGFTVMKTVMGGTDFMSAGPFFTYNDTPGDVEMKLFSIARDLAPDGLVPYIKAARKHGSFLLQTTMDYPPDWMMFDVEKNQNIDPKYYGALATYYLKYLRAYEAQGIKIDYLTLFNEPGNYTKIPYEGIRDLLKNHVGPLFEREGITAKLQMSEHVDRQNALKSYPTVLDDPEARKYVSSLPYHGYDWRRKEKPSRQNNYRADEFAPIAELAKRYPDLPLWMSEICYYNWGTPWANPLPRYEFVDGDFWGHQLFQDIAAGASAWTYWNMILDEEGGPWLVSLVHGDPAINHQQPVVIVNRRTKEVTYTGLYYYLAHFSKFVRPGSVRIGADGTVEDVRCLAFKATDGKVVVQLMNSAESTKPVRISWLGKSFTVELPRISITTCEWKTD